MATSSTVSAQARILRLRKARQADRFGRPKPRVVSTEAAASSLRRSGHAFEDVQGPIRVLVVEDNRPLRDAAGDALAKRGMIVMKVPGPKELPRLVKRFRPDVIVLDDRFSRAGVDFRTIVPFLAERFPNVKVVVTSETPVPPLSSGAHPSVWGATRVVEKATMFRDHTLGRSVVEAASS